MASSLAGGGQWRSPLRHPPIDEMVWKFGLFSPTKVIGRTSVRETATPQDTAHDYTLDTNSSRAPRCWNNSTVPSLYTASDTPLCFAPGPSRLSDGVVRVQGAWTDLAELSCDRIRCTAARRIGGSSISVVIHEMILGGMGGGKVCWEGVGVVCVLWLRCGVGSGGGCAVWMCNLLSIELCVRGLLSFFL